MTTCFATLSIAALLTASALAAPGWHDDFEAARKLAEREKKDLLLEFTGSDWCVWCIKLKEEVFDHEVFRREVADKFVLVEIDFPHDASILSEATHKQNEGLKRDYAIRAYPAIVLCDAAGRPYAQTGYQAGGPEAYLKHLNEERAKREVRDAAFAKAAKAEGEERAAALEAALGVVPRETLGTLYQSEFDELGALAPDSTLVTSVRAAAKSDQQRSEFRDFFTRQDFEGAVTHADALIAKQNLEGEAKQQVLLYKLNAFVAMDRYDEALAVAEQIREIAPESRFGSGVDRLRQHLKTLKEEQGKEQGKEQG